VGGTINGLLGSSGSVNSGHQTINNTKVVVDNLGKRGQTVGCARGVGDDLVFRLVSIEVNTTDKHGGISRGSRDDDLLGTTLDMSVGRVEGGEDTGGFNNIVGTNLTPRDLGRITFTKDLNGLTVDDELTILGFDITLEATVNGIILQHVDHVVKGNEGIVDSNNIDVRAIDSSAEDNTTNTTETIEVKLINVSQLEDCVADLLHTR
jgi:hypothetical protein